MAELLITKKVGKGHQHIVYLRDDGTGITTTVRDHSHDLMFRQAVQAVIDPYTGQSIHESVNSGWEMMPGPDGHTHEIEQYPAEIKSEPEDDDKKVVEDVLTLYKEVKDIEKESMDAAQESEEMYSHRQWDDKTVNNLASKDRAALTVNQLESKIDNLSGYQRQNRTEIRYIPMEGGDQAIADILNYVTKDILENCYYQREKSSVFIDMCVPGRGFFNHYEDRDKNILGDVVIERYEWDGAGCGPHHKEDLSDCDYIVKWKWFSKAKIREMYPDKASRLTPENKESDVPATSKSEDWDKRHSESKTGGVWDDADLVDLTKKQYRLLSVERKEYRRIYILVNAQDDFVFNADGWSESDAKAVKTIPGFSLIPRVVFRIRQSKVAGGVMLEDNYPDLAIQDFSLIPCYAKKRGDRWWGKLEGGKDFQRLINKTYSQFVDILNKVVSYGWFYDDNTFVDKKEEQNFKNNSSSPGFVAKLQDVNHRPVKEEGVKFPTEIVNAIALFNNSLREVLNVNLEMLGSDTGQQSGIAMRQKIIQQLLGNDFIFDNLSFAEKKIGKILISYIQKLYTPQRIMRVLTNQSMSAINSGMDQLQVGGIPVDQWSIEAIDMLLNTKDITAHDVNVTESPSSPSAQMSNFMLMTELAGKGVPIPPEVIIEFAPVPQSIKTKIMASIQSQQQAQAEQEKMKYDTEIQKAQIAQQGKLLSSMPNMGQGGIPRV
jgi:hypothetical protein